jgi:hypothetical protein
MNAGLSRCFLIDDLLWLSPAAQIAGPGGDLKAVRATGAALGDPAPALMLRRRDALSR